MPRTKALHEQQALAVHCHIIELDTLAAWMYCNASEQCILKDLKVVVLSASPHPPFLSPCHLDCRLHKLQNGSESTEHLPPDTQPAQHDQATAKAPAAIAKQPSSNGTAPAAPGAAAPAKETKAQTVSDAAPPAPAVRDATTAISTGNVFNFLDGAAEEQHGPNGADATPQTLGMELQEGARRL